MCVDPRLSRLATCAEKGQSRGRLGGSGTVILGIPAKLYERLSEFMARKDFASVAELIVHVLQDEAANDEHESGSSERSARAFELVRERRQQTNGHA